MVMNARTAGAPGLEASLEGGDREAELNKTEDAPLDPDLTAAGEKGDMVRSQLSPPCPREYAIADTC